MISTLLALAVLPQSSFAREVEGLMGSRTEANVRRMFKDRDQASPLFDFMIRNRKPAAWAMFPPPPGLHGDAHVIFSRFQDIEQETDVHFEVRDGKISSFIPEHNTFNYDITDMAVVARLIPEAHRIDVDTTLNLTYNAPAQSMVARLNAPYRIDEAWVEGRPSKVITVEKDQAIQPQEGDVVRAGSLVIVWTSKPIKKLRLKYHGEINEKEQDKITPNAAYVTAWWVPSIGRLPHFSDVTVQAPADWQFRSEGNSAEPAVEEHPMEGMVWKRWKCPFPISYPKIIGGRYKLAYELRDGPKTYRSWQFEPVSVGRAKKDCELMRKSMAFLENKLPPFPFDSFECYDADTYYGIESYSHTLLQKHLTTQFITHELTHTWFGGLAPNAYAKDTWNEGVTQYVDSVLFANNADKTLETGFRSAHVKVPLSEMNVAHGWDSLSYRRGAYVMNMLAAEIGMEKMWDGLRRLATDFRGGELTWIKLKDVFEQVSGQDLDWFWDQWVTNGHFPFLNQPFDPKLNGDGTASVMVSQYGTRDPFRIDFDFVIMSRDNRVLFRQRHRLTERSKVITFAVPPNFDRVAFQLEPYTLAQLGDGEPDH